MLDLRYPASHSQLPLSLSEKSWGEGVGKGIVSLVPGEGGVEISRMLEEWRLRGEFGGRGRSFGNRWGVCFRLRLRGEEGFRSVCFACKS